MWSMTASSCNRSSASLAVSMTGPRPAINRNALNTSSECWLRATRCSPLGPCVPANQCFTVRSLAPGRRAVAGSDCLRGHQRQRRRLEIERCRLAFTLFEEADDLLQLGVGRSDRRKTRSRPRFLRNTAARRLTIQSTVSGAGLRREERPRVQQSRQVAAPRLVHGAGLLKIRRA